MLEVPAGEKLDFAARTRRSAWLARSIHLGRQRAPHDADGLERQSGDGVVA
jgi:hypothetical protein